MPTFDRHKPGAFCWIELGTTDQNAAKEFYNGLLAWAANDFPMGPGQFYTMFNLGARTCGAAYTLRPEDQANGVPPHWMLYVQAESADATASKAAAAGGKVVAGPFDVMDFGRMAVLADPAGAMFSLWEARSHTGLQVSGEPGAFCWADLSTPDQEGAKRFYEAVFPWKLEASETDSSGYLHIKNGEDFIGGVPPAHTRNPKAPPHWLLYFMVQSCDAATIKAKELGARVYLEPMTIDKVGRWSIVADPQGAVFALFEAMRHA